MNSIIPLRPFSAATSERLGRMSFLTCSMGRHRPRYCLRDAPPAGRSVSSEEDAYADTMRPSSAPSDDLSEHLFRGGSWWRMSPDLRRFPALAHFGVSSLPSAR